MLDPLGALEVPRHRHVEPSLEDVPVGDLLGERSPDDLRQERGLSDGIHQARDEQPVHRRAVSDAQQPLVRGGVVRDLDGPIRGGEHAARLIQERPAGIRELDQSVVAYEERHLHDPLELLNLLRQRRLGHVQSTGGAAEVKLLSDRDEVPEVTQGERRIH